MPKTSVTTSLITAALLAACASGRRSGGTTTTTTPTGTGTMVSSTTTLNSAGTTTTTSGGDVDMANGGLWSEGANGLWMDTTGAMRLGGRSGRMMGLQGAEISRMNNANIVAHLAAGDSLEVQLSQTVLAHAQNQSVRDFAQRMINEHTQHMQQGRQLAMQNGITPTPAPGDTLDVMLTTRMMNRLTNGMGNMNMSSSTSGSTSGSMSGMSGGASDRQAMGAEVAMHRHMLQELNMLQPQATGGARTLVDQTFPVVRQHLTDAESIWRQVGGGNGRNGSR